MHLEGTWPVYRAEEAVGSCEFIPQGLYWKIHCTVGTAWAGVSRLVLFSDHQPLSLGIPVPQGGILTLEKKLPRKSLPQEGAFSLELLPADAPLIRQRMELESVPQSPPEQVLEETPKEMPRAEREIEPTLEAREETPSQKADAQVPEDWPEEPPGEEPQDRLSSEDMPEAMPAKKPQEEIQAQIPPEEAQQELSCGTASKVIPFQPGEPLPCLKNWQQLRAVPDGSGGFLLHWAEGSTRKNN